MLSGEKEKGSEYFNVEQLRRDRRVFFFFGLGVKLWRIIVEYLPWK